MIRTRFAFSLNFQMPDINKSSNLGDTAEISSMNTSAAKNHATDSIVLERISPHSRIEDPFVTINRNEISFPDGKNGKKIIPLALIENITANEQCVGKDSCDHISCGILRRAINMHEIAVVVQGIQRRGEPDGEFSKFEVLTRVEKEPGS